MRYPGFFCQNSWPYAMKKISFFDLFRPRATVSFFFLLNRSMQELTFRNFFSTASVSGFSQNIHPMSTPLRIQKIESEGQLAACAHILVEAYNSEPWNDAWTPEKALEKLTCFYNSPKFLGWMAFEGDQLMGATVGNIEPYFSGDYFYLKEMFISPKAQRKGVGSALFEALKSHLDSAGIGMMILFTSHQSFPFDFWQKTGFREMEGMRMMFFTAEG